MEFSSLVLLFYTAIEDDVCIGPTHISIYIALLRQWHLQGKINPFVIERLTTMKAAKIKSRFTYNKGMNDLQARGYIEYLPASNAFSKSVIELTCIAKLLYHGNFVYSNGIRL